MLTEVEKDEALRRGTIASVQRGEICEGGAVLRGRRARGVRNDGARGPWARRRRAASKRFKGLLRYFFQQDSGTSAPFAG